MSYTTRIHLFKEDIKFSAAHFTIFSAEERERLHGHNFRVRASFVSKVTENGMPCDYNLFKSKLREVCQSLDEYMLLPGNSRYLKITEHQKDYYKVTHHHDDMFFLKKDTLILPVENITVEELAVYLIERIKKNNPLLENNIVTEIEVQVASGDGQYAGSVWTPQGNIP